MSHVCLSRLPCKQLQCYCTALSFPLPMTSKRKQVNRLFRAFSSLENTSTPCSSSSSLMLIAQLSPSNTPQRSEEWFALRKDRLTMSSFSTALGFWKGTRRAEHRQEKVFSVDADNITKSISSLNAMEWGVVNESAAIDRYKSITGNECTCYFRNRTTGSRDIYMGLALPNDWWRIWICGWGFFRET